MPDSLIQQTTHQRVSHQSINCQTVSGLVETPSTVYKTINRQHVASSQDTFSNEATNQSVFVVQNSKGKAQPVPESVQNGEAHQNSFYAKDMPAAPNQAMLPQLSPRSPGTTDYDGAMSLPSSIAPPKTGVPYIDKHELRYGAAYGTAEEATSMTSTFPPAMR